MSENPNRNWWEYYEIQGIAPFKGRMVGDLSFEELNLIKTRWLPVALEKWEHASEEQREDMKAILDCVRYREKGFM